MVKSKTKKTTKSSLRSFHSTHMDLVFSIMIVSLAVNLFVLIGWIALQVTDAYDEQVAIFLFGS